MPQLLSQPLGQPLSPPVSSQEMEVAAWSDLDLLVADLDTLTEHLGALGSYGRRWVCRPDGVQTSPVCLLRPVAGAFDLLSEALRDLEDAARADLIAVQAAVVAGAADLHATDGRVQRSMGAVAGGVEVVAAPALGPVTAAAA
ncbi:hypothetical protein [Nocardioides sp.]|uniref:hypothetical protein n=1 Tax=Nocardioides sp. TaxID=35761 RepID=UPI00351728B5